MTVILTPDPTSSEIVAANLHGDALALPPGATEILVTTLAGSRLLRGFYVFGETDGVAWIEVDGAKLQGFESRINVVEQTAAVLLPNPEPYASPTAIVELKVRNDGSAAYDFRGVLLGQ